MNVWNFVSGKKKESLTFHPHLAMNDYAGLAAALVAGSGIGDLPPLVQPELLRDGRLVEVMPTWHFATFYLWLVHTGNRYLTRPVRLFKDFASRMAPTLFPKLQLEGRRSWQRRQRSQQNDRSRMNNAGSSHARKTNSRFCGLIGKSRLGYRVQPWVTDRDLMSPERPCARNGRSESR